MANDRRNSVRVFPVCRLRKRSSHANVEVEHTMLVTEDGVEVLTARKPDSPGGPIVIPEEQNRASGANGVASSVNGAKDSTK